MGATRQLIVTATLLYPGSMLMTAVGMSGGPAAPDTLHGQEKSLKFNDLS
jgi:hypothetical protein